MQTLLAANLALFYFSMLFYQLKAVPSAFLEVDGTTCRTLENVNIIADEGS